MNINVNLLPSGAEDFPDGHCAALRLAPPTADLVAARTIRPTGQLQIE
jgi:hypothetical protein